MYTWIIGVSYSTILKLIKSLFTKSGYHIYPAGADASNQNGPIERGHCTVVNTIWALLTGSGISTKFGLYTLYNALRLHNATPTRTFNLLPLTRATNNIQEDFINLCTFGCRVWARPPRKQSTKLIPDSQKWIFLGYVPYATCNILWYYPDTNRVKISTHASFDERYNNIPTSEIVPNVVHLQCTKDRVCDSNTSTNPGRFWWHW